MCSKRLRMMELNVNPRRMESFDGLYQLVEEEINGDHERLNENIAELCNNNHLEQLVSNSDDIVMYKANSDLSWSFIMNLINPICRKILLYLINNSKCFFILLNTQFGKLWRTGKEIASWREFPDKRVVSFLVVDNDRTLSDQSVNGLFQCFPVKAGMEESNDPHEKYDVKIFELSTNTKVSYNEIITYIDAYAYNPDYAMPLIVVLSNNKQMEKLVNILYHITHHRCNTLYAAGCWDEADKTYPQFRNKSFQVKNRPGIQTSFLQLLNHPNDKIIRNGFVTATEGSLLDDYDECENAELFEIDTSSNRNYISIHHQDCKKRPIQYRDRETNNEIAERIILDNWNTHFNNPYRLANGDLYHHKIIVNGDTKNEEMRQFAQKLRGRANIMTFNQRGVTLYTENDTKTYSTRKKIFRELLFQIYKENGLANKVLIIIGRRKIDRGLGFHYAPRNGSEGLIWTDMIMGKKIEHIPSAVQKAGRLAGIILQCPQYPGEINYWIDDESWNTILTHYEKVDHINNLNGSNTMRQAMDRIEPFITSRRRNHDIDEDTYRVIKGRTSEDTLEITGMIVREVLHQTFRRPTLDVSSNQYQTSLNNQRSVVSLLDAVKKTPNAHGRNNGVTTYRRYLPCYYDMNDVSSLCCVIPFIDPTYTQEMKNTIDREYADYIIRVPQQGDFQIA